MIVITWYGENISLSAIITSILGIQNSTSSHTYLPSYLPTEIRPLSHYLSLQRKSLPNIHHQTLSHQVACPGMRGLCTSFSERELRNSGAQIKNARTYYKPCKTSTAGDSPSPWWLGTIIVQVGFLLLLTFSCYPNIVLRALNWWTKVVCLYLLSIASCNVKTDTGDWMPQHRCQIMLKIVKLHAIGFAV